jgi:predicted acyl esterase
MRTASFRLSLAVLSLILMSCSGVPPGNEAPSDGESAADFAAWIAELPGLGSLTAEASRRISDETDRIAGYSIENDMSVNVEHALTPDSAILHSTNSELSWVIYRYAPEHFADDVPYIAPYLITIGALNTEEFWLAVADYGTNAWRIQPATLSPGPGESEVTIEIGLEPNAADVTGTFSFAIIAYGGAEPQIPYIDLAYPDAPAPDQPVDYHQFISARDGIALATDVYLPYAEDSPAVPDPPYPVLLLRTPYDKAIVPSWLVPTLTQGNIAVLVQYFRGRLNAEPPGGWPDSWPHSWPDSEGTSSMFRDDCGPLHYDAIDTVEWVEARPWYNGQLLLAGASATGGWVYQAATQLGDRVTAIYPQLCAGDMGEWAIRTNGCYRRSNVEGWIAANGLPSALQEQVEDNLENEAFWGVLDFDQYAAGTDCPGYHETGWYDVNVDATIKSWRALAESGGPAAAGNQWLIIGPWTHDAPRARSAGDLVFLDDGSLHDPGVLPAGWDGALWMLNEVGRLPFPFTSPENRVLVFLVGQPDANWEYNNQWLELPTWPPDASGERVRYLNDPQPPGSGLLDSLPMAGQVAFTTDPHLPIPALGGANLPFDGVIEAGPLIQNSVMSLDGVLDFFHTDDMGSGDTHYIGVPHLVLYVSTDAEDTDVMIKLIHNDGLGDNYLICDTAVRLSHYLAAQGLGEVVADTTYELEIDLGNIAQTFDWTEEVHLVIQGTNYPRFDINPGNGDPIYNGTNGVEQTTTIYYGDGHPSRLIMPEWEPGA